MISRPYKLAYQSAPTTQGPASSFIRDYSDSGLQDVIKKDIEKHGGGIVGIAGYLSDSFARFLGLKPTLTKEDIEIMTQEVVQATSGNRTGSGSAGVSPNQPGSQYALLPNLLAIFKPQIASGATPKCGTQNGCAESCYKLGNSRYGINRYRMNPRQINCTTCQCNFTKCGTQNGCNESCYKLGNSRYGVGRYRMSPKQSSCTNCSCNFVKCGTQSGCERACPSKSGYTKSPRQVNCTTCYCNYRKIAFRCPYSGCSGTTSASQCFLCRCRGICNNALHGGVKSVSSNGSCFCNK